MSKDYLYRRSQGENFGFSICIRLFFILAIGIVLSRKKLLNLFSFAASESAPTPASRSATSPSNTRQQRKVEELAPQRVILTYPLEGCVDTRSSHNPIVQGRDARDTTIRQLQEKVAEFMHVKVMEHVSATSNFDTLEGYQKRKNVQSVRETPLDTRYLEALQMEVIKTVPPGMDDSDLSGLAETLPCIEGAYKDVNKYGRPDDPAEGDLPENGDSVDSSSAKGVGASAAAFTDRLTSRLTSFAENSAFHIPNIGIPAGTGRKSRGVKPFFGKTGSGWNSTDSDGKAAHNEEAWKRLLRTNLEKYRGLDSISLSNTVIRSYDSNPAGSCSDGEHKCAEMTPNDPYFYQQWNLKDSWLGGIQAENAWSLWTGEKNPMTVAIIDSGCDLSHNDLIDKRWVNPGETCGDGIDNDGNGLIDDCHGYDFVNNTGDVTPGVSGHGTGASGIIAAEANNSLGLTGICWGCKIMCLKFIGGGKGTVSNQVQAIDYAVKMGAWVSNNSYGGYGFAEMEYRAIERAQQAGHLFVTSAGNHDLDTDLPQNDHTPSGYQLDNIISVGATTRRNKKATFSNYGKASVDLMAPGNAVHTTKTGQAYGPVSGTSFAAPHVAGASALIWSGFPNLSFLEIKEAILEGSDRINALEPYSLSGGKLNLYGSMYVAAKLTLGYDHVRESKFSTFLDTKKRNNSNQAAQHPGNLSQEDEWADDWVQSMAYGGTPDTQLLPSVSSNEVADNDFGIPSPLSLGGVLNNLLVFNRLAESKTVDSDPSHLKSLENVAGMVENKSLNLLKPDNVTTLDALQKLQQSSIPSIPRLRSFYVKNVAFPLLTKAP